MVELAESTYGPNTAFISVKYPNLPVSGPALGAEENVTLCARPRHGPFRTAAAHDRMTLYLPECLDDGSEGKVRRQSVDTFVKSSDHSAFGAFNRCRAMR